MLLFFLHVKNWDLATLCLLILTIGARRPLEGHLDIAGWLELVEKSFDVANFDCVLLRVILFQFQHFFSNHLIQLGRNLVLFHIALHVFLLIIGFTLLELQHVRSALSFLLVEAFIDLGRAFLLFERHLFMQVVDYHFSETLRSRRHALNLTRFAAHVELQLLVVAWFARAGSIKWAGTVVTTLLDLDGGVFIDWKPLTSDQAISCCIWTDFLFLFFFRKLVNFWPSLTLDCILLITRLNAYVVFKMLVWLYHFLLICLRSRWLCQFVDIQSLDDSLYSFEALVILLAFGRLLLEWRLRSHFLEVRLRHHARPQVIGPYLVVLRCQRLIW